MPEVVLVSMPWAPVHEPSLGLGILKSCLVRHGISCAVFHAAPELLRWLSVETYQFIADSWGVNELSFTGLIDEIFDEKQVRRLAHFLEKCAASQKHPKYRTALELGTMLAQVRGTVIPQFVTHCVSEILNQSPRVVGFTCLFDQIIAAAVVAKQLREIRPDIQILFGGYALHGTVAKTVASAFPWIDAIVLGDGERAIVEVTTQLLKQEACKSDRSLPGTRILNADKVAMTDVPLPEYDDWFAQTSRLASEHKVRITTKVLPVEASRGCWWGQKSHCIFCGIDDETLRYRFRSSEETLNMLHHLRQQYGDHTFRFSDYIMPKAYYGGLLPKLAAEPTKFHLHSEVKSNHDPNRIRDFAAAGYREIQPGIESFSTRVLRAMKKGARGIDNVCLLKAGYRNEIVIHYNILYGLPSDCAADYERILESLPRIYHLMPPVSRTETVITRYAPLQIDPGRFGLTKARHHPCYDILFSDAFLEKSGFSLDDYAYYFERNFEYPPELELLYSQLVLQIDHWKDLHRSRFVELSYSQAGDLLEFVDTRFNDECRFALDASMSLVYKACDLRPISLDHAFNIVNLNSRTSRSAFDRAVQALEEFRVVWIEDELIFGLGIELELSNKYRATEWSRNWESLYV